MEGNCSSNKGDQEVKPRRTDSTAEDVNGDQEGKPRRTDSTAEDVVNVGTEEGNGSEAKDRKGKEIIADAEEENTPQEQSSLVDGGSTDQDGSMVRSAGKTMLRCRYCPKEFSSAQALGGHQNSHKQERELAKRSRRQHGRTFLNPPTPIYPKYNPSFVSFPLPNPNMFNLQGPSSPPLYPLISPNTQYHQWFNSFMTNLGQFAGQPPSGMWFNNMDLTANYESLMTIGRCPNTNGYMNSSFGIVGGPRGGTSQGFRAPNSNSMGIVGGLGSGSTTRGVLRLNSHSHSSGAGNTSGEARSLSGLSEGENNNDGDGTIDLLSGVGMGSGEDREEMNGDHDDNDTELRL